MRISRFYVAGAGIAIVIIGAFTLSITHTNKEMDRMQSVSATSTDVLVTILSLHDAYKKGVHTISGNIEVPTPCHDIVTNVAVNASSSPPRIRIDLTVSSDPGVCLLITATKSFSARASIGPDAMVDVYANGLLATTTSP